MITVMKNTAINMDTIANGGQMTTAAFLQIPVIALDMVWNVSHIFNALMAISNLTAIVLLSEVIADETKKWLNNLDGKDDREIPVVKK